MKDSYSFDIDKAGLDKSSICTTRLSKDIHALRTEVRGG